MDMESNSKVNDLMVLECEEELKLSDRVMRRRPVGQVIVYCTIVAMMTLLSVNTIILEGKKEKEIKVEALYARDCTQWKSENSTGLKLMCQYVNKFPLSEDIFVRICVKENNVAIDIRRYRGHEATEEGIQLNLNQWLYLKSSVRHIDSSITKSDS